LLEGIQNGVILIGAPGLAYEMFAGIIILIAMLLQVGLRRLPLTQAQKNL
jgi:ribose/xylose/arabinose/galactoside ABC-type transport system permease subunit